MNCLFMSDLHGDQLKLTFLNRYIMKFMPEMVFLAGDIFPGVLLSHATQLTFLEKILIPFLHRLKIKLGRHYPKIFFILGNDDGAIIGKRISELETTGLYHYVHNRAVVYGDYTICGYNFVPPSPFRNKDWEKYDVSRYVDPGCTAPSEGFLSIPRNHYDLNYSTIKKDLDEFPGVLSNPEKTIILFHSPPYNTNLDIANLHGKYYDYVPLDIHVGSWGIRNYILEQQPLLTLHGHVHESSVLSGMYYERLGKTLCLNAARPSGQKGIIWFNLNNLMEKGMITM